MHRRTDRSTKTLPSLAVETSKPRACRVSARQAQPGRRGLLPPSWPLGPALEVPMHHRVRSTDIRPYDTCYTFSTAFGFEAATSVSPEAVYPRTVGM